MNYRIFSRLVIALAMLACSGCGGGDSDSQDMPKIEDLFFNRSEVGLTDQVDLNIQFSFDGGRVFGAHQAVAILIRISSGLEFVEGSGRVPGDGGDQRVIAQVEYCTNGDTFITYALRNTLENASSPKGADAELSLSVRGKILGPAGAEARAQYVSVPGSCTEGIIPDAGDVIAVVPR